MWFGPPSISVKCILTRLAIVIFVKCRRTAHAWRPLGYVANENVFFSGSERNENLPDGKSLRLHKILDSILQSYKAAQLPGALSHSKIRLGQIEKVVNLYVPLQFIIGDVEGGDQLCSRQSYRGKQCPRICRTCDVSTLNCVKTDIRCKRIEVSHIRHLVDTQNIDALKLLAQRPTYNCFYDIDNGKDPYGIFSMVHTEGLHALEVGVMKYMVEILMTELPSTQHRTLDRLVKKLNRSPHQHGYVGFPRCTWSDGVTTLAQLTGDQRVGKMFAILLVALTEEGKTFISTHLPGGNETWKKMVYCFEQMLCYWVWLKQDHFWMAGDIEACHAATKSIRIMARQLQVLWPRQDGLQWSLTKLHEQFHVPYDIHRHGNHYNVHSGPQEHNHIGIKSAAKKTQMQKHKIDLQTGERIVDRLILQRAFDRVRETVRQMDQAIEDKDLLDGAMDIDTGGIVFNATKGTVVMIQAKNSDQNKSPIIQIDIRWNRRKHNPLTKKILSQHHLFRFLRDQFFQDHSAEDIDDAGIAHNVFNLRCFTEYQRNGVNYRCHPKYRGDRPYYDWSYVDWETDDNTIISLLGRIHLFIETPSGEIKAVVQSVDMTTRKQFSVLGTTWTLEHTGPNDNLKPIFHLVEVDCLGDHAMVIPFNVLGNKFIHIQDRSEWADNFHKLPVSTINT